MQNLPEPIFSSQVPTVKLAKQIDGATEFELISDSDTDRSIFVWNENFYPAWRVKLGNEELPVRKSNGWAMAVEIPPMKRGETLHLRFYFDDRFFQWGKLLGLIWVLSFLLALAFQKKSVALRL